MRSLPAPLHQLMERLTHIRPGPSEAASINNGLEEAEETVNRDIPPLTGENIFFSYTAIKFVKMQYFIFFLNRQINCINLSS